MSDSWRRRVGRPVILTAILTASFCSLWPSPPARGQEGQDEEREAAQAEVERVCGKGMELLFAERWQEALRAAQLAALKGDVLPGLGQPLTRGARSVTLEEAGDPRLEGTRHPFYWASFILSGETGALTGL